MKDKIMRAIEKILKENGFVNIKVLGMNMGVKEKEQEIVAIVRIRAQK